MSPLVGDVVLCGACGKRALDHTQRQRRRCFLAQPKTIEQLLANRALVCEGTDDMHDATLMADDGGAYCEAHQPRHTAVVVPEASRLLMYVVYDHPADFPDGYVIRRWKVQDGKPAPTNEAYTAQSIDGIRSEMERCGLTCFPRQPEDDPAILETWM